MQYFNYSKTLLVLFFPDKHHLKLFVFAQYIDQACDLDTQLPKSQSHLNLCVIFVFVVKH